MKYLSIVIIISASIAYSQGKTSIPAPYGLNWGSGTHNTPVQCLSMEPDSEDPDISVCQTEEVPKNIPGIESYLLVYYKNKLVKTAAIGNTIEDDSRGYDGKEEYDRLKTKLTEKYGSPLSIEYSGAKVYESPDYFYQCLDLAGCGKWTSWWGVKESENYDEKTSVSITLELKATSYGNGYIVVTHESPYFREYLRILKKKQATQTEEAI